MSEHNWHKYFIKMAQLVATKSKDTSTKVGAVIVGDDHEVLSTGFNGFPRGVDETNENRWERPVKYKFVEHAERNAIHNAARNGVRLKGATLYMNYEPCPCVECTKAVIQAGIRHIVGPFTKFPGKGDHWREELSISTIMLDEANITRTKVRMK